jgi:hypothetical protein
MKQLFDRQEKVHLEYLAEAFIMAGIEVDYSPDGLIWLPNAAGRTRPDGRVYAKAKPNEFQRIIGADQIDLQDDLARASCGKLVCHLCNFYVLHDNPQYAIKEKLAWIKMIMTGDGTEISLANIMPVDYQNLTIFKFEPDSDFIDETAKFWQFDQESPNGIWISEQKMRIIFLVN